MLGIGIHTHKRLAHPGHLMQVVQAALTHHKRLAHPGQSLYISLEKTKRGALSEHVHAF